LETELTSNARKNTDRAKFLQIALFRDMFTLLFAP
jgi:hypothetical protein